MVAGAIATGVSLAASQITAGTLVTGVEYAGQINATQVNAGEFNGFSFVGCTFTATGGDNVTISVDTSNHFYLAYTTGNGLASLSLAGGHGGGYGLLTLMGTNVPIGSATTIKLIPATTTIAGAGGSCTLPANPSGFLLHVIGGTNRWIPYY
jgi:hypothetical protein